MASRSINCPSLRKVSCPFSRMWRHAVGEISRDALPYRCTQALARLRGRELHAFPGGHSGDVNRAQACGEERRHVLATGSSPATAALVP